LSVGITITAAWAQDDNAYRLYGTPKYIRTEHLLMGFVAIGVFVLGCGLARLSTPRVSAPRPGTNHLVKFWFYLASCLTIVGYIVWMLIGLKNGFSPGMLIDLVTATDSSLYGSVREDYFATMPGVTTCTQFAVAALLLGLWLFVHGERRILWPLAIILPMAAIRCILFSERMALAELLFPLIIVALRVYVLGRPLSPAVRKLLFAAPVIGVLGLFLFFGFFEYFRSWNHYQTSFNSFPEFVVWRLSGYYTTAHNNGAMALVTNQPRPIPYFTIRPFWEFPGVSKSSFSYYELTGMDVPANHVAMLDQYGTLELNNEGGLFQPALEFGWAGFLVYWFGYGFISTKIYQRFLGGTLLGLALYPLVYLSVLEVPLALLLFYTRFFPPLVTLMFVSWLASREAPKRRLPALAYASDVRGPPPATRPDLPCESSL